MKVNKNQTELNPAFMMLIPKITDNLGSVGHSLSSNSFPSLNGQLASSAPRWCELGIHVWFHNSAQAFAGMLS